MGGERDERFAIAAFTPHCLDADLVNRVVPCAKAKAAFAAPELLKPAVDPPPSHSLSEKYP